MCCYLGFPLTAFLSYNRPDLFGQNRDEVRRGVRERMFHSRDSDEVRYEKQMEFRSHVRDIQERQMMEPKKKISPEEWTYTSSRSLFASCFVVSWLTKALACPLLKAALCLSHHWVILLRANTRTYSSVKNTYIYWMDYDQSWNKCICFTSQVALPTEVLKSHSLSLLWRDNAPIDKTTALSGSSRPGW